ncbi:homoserine dehydrogenase [Clostridium estertheticum]|uniref:homoserine dehydrogenase n=1 Tax=Clostridium estertheticum TaxID=238834 RepID=UPI0013E916EF|nr:homoserine dehydrogenase [Clostridium estertheticum]MBZ9686296.1 homoserine dehydrogenase [Clostridium estertheticum]
MRIAVIGYGGLGKAFISLIENKKDELHRDGYNFQVNYILNSSGGIYDPEGINYEDLLGFSKMGKNIINYPKGGSCELNFNKLLENNDVDVLIELTPTNKETGGAGMLHIRKALETGIHVITANKGPILLAYNELRGIAVKNNVQLAIGCTTGGALPAINAGMFDLAGSEILSIEGILNGTTNFILKEMEDNALTYIEALKKAQELGIAETDPTLDVEGFDTASKLLILTNVLMHESKTLNDITVDGITNITPQDINNAKIENKKYKLMGRTCKINNGLIMTVNLEKLEPSHALYKVEGKNKAVRFTSDTLGDLTVLGGASGVTPAAASILRDLINIINGYKFCR